MLTSYACLKRNSGGRHRTVTRNTSAEQTFSLCLRLLSSLSEPFSPRYERWTEKRSRDVSLSPFAILYPAWSPSLAISWISLLPPPHLCHFGRLLSSSDRVPRPCRRRRRRRRRDVDKYKRCTLSISSAYPFEASLFATSLFIRRRTR